MLYHQLIVHISDLNFQIFQFKFQIESHHFQTFI